MAAELETALDDLVRRFGPGVLDDADGLGPLLDDFVVDRHEQVRARVVVDAVRLRSWQRLRDLRAHGAAPDAALDSAAAHLVEIRGGTDPGSAREALAALAGAAGLLVDPAASAAETQQPSLAKPPATTEAPDGGTTRLGTPPPTLGAGRRSPRRTSADTASGSSAPREASTDVEPRASSPVGDSVGRWAEQDPVRPSPRTRRAGVALALVSTVAAALVWAGIELLDDSTAADDVELSPTPAPPTCGAASRSTDPCLPRAAEALEDEEFLFAVRTRGSDRLSRGDVDGTTRELQLAQTETETYPNVSPDRRSFIYLGRNSEGVSDLWVAGVDGEDERLLFPEQRPCPRMGPPAWSPDGTKLALICKDRDGSTRKGVYVVTLDGQTLDVLDRGRYCSSPAWSEDGVLAYRSRTRIAERAPGALVTIDADGDEEALPVAGTGTQDGHPSWSSDGEYVAFQRTTLAGTNDVWVVSPDKGALIEIDAGIGPDVGPIWSPASDHELIYSNEGSLYLDDPTDERGATPLPIAGDNLWSPAWGRR